MMIFVIICGINNIEINYPRLLKLIYKIYKGLLIQQPP
jgi:hypothetical protein